MRNYARIISKLLLKITPGYAKDKTSAQACKHNFSSNLRCAAVEQFFNLQATGAFNGGSIINKIDNVILDQILRAL